MLEPLGSATRSAKLAAIAAPTASSSNRARPPIPAQTLRPSPPVTPSRPASAPRQSLPPRADCKLGHGRPPTPNPAPAQAPATPRFCRLSTSQASSPSSDRRSLSVDHGMASSNGKSAPRLPSSSLEKLSRQSSNARITGNGGKPGDLPRRKPASAAPPKKAIKDAAPPSANRKSSQSLSEVKPGSRERSLSRVELNGQPAHKPRREKVGVKGRRRGYHISDLPSRRRALSHRGHPSKREIQLRRNSLDDSAADFPLLNLEEYLKERGPRSKLATLDVASPSSLISSLHKRNSMLLNQSAMILGESAPHLNSVGIKDPRLLAKFSVHAYVSDAESTEVGNQPNSDKSGYSRSLRRPASSRPAKSEGLLHYAGSCFNVSTRRVEGRRRHIAYMYNSERSLSSFGSDTEMAPLMTEPEPFHEFSDDQCASSAEADEPRLYDVRELTYNKFKDTHPQSFDDAALKAYKSIHAHEDSYGLQDHAEPKPRETACKHRSISQKYRPKSFRDILGQKMVAESLSNAIIRSKIAPVYLFYGPRGTGKTTAAKIFTCAMNCLTIEELRPCGLCKECTSFNAGTNYDMKEVDAAGNNEIESMKVMLKHACLPPSVSRYKVFIMDDCHMLTSEAWNALLKSLEEPPEYVVFILITTNVEQLPRAAISRCQKFMFSRVKDADIVFRLKKLAQLEKVDVELDALHFIASQSDGSLRDGEMMLDQLSLLGKKVTLRVVREMVGLIPEDDLFKLLEMALSANTVNTVNTIRALLGSGVEPLALTSQLALLITDILAGRCQIPSYAEPKVKKDQQDKLQHALKILSDLEKQLRSCSDRTTWFTAAFLQLSTSNNFHISSSRCTSATQSPAVFADTREIENQNLDSARRKNSWGSKEKWDAINLLQVDRLREQSLCESSSGQFLDSRIYPCDHSPQSGTSVDEKIVCKMQGRTERDSYDDACGILSPNSMDEVLQKVLRANPSKMLKQLLQGEGRLISISLAEGFALVRLEFKSLEHKNIAERAKQNISKAFQTALLCPVKIEISLSSAQGLAISVDRGSDHIIQMHSEKHSKRMLSDIENGRGSCREPSFRNREYASLSLRYYELESRKSLHGIDGEAHANCQGDADTVCKDLQVYRAAGEPVLYTRQESADGGYVSEHRNLKEQRNSFDDPRFSASLRWSDTREDMEYSSDSENDGRYAPGLLCWKSSRMKDGRGKHHHAIRRRKARFLLRLVPCGKEEAEEDESISATAEV